MQGLVPTYLPALICVNFSLVFWTSAHQPSFSLPTLGILFPPTKPLTAYAITST